MQPVLLVIGTRPEAIKMIPVYVAFKKAGIAVLLCSSTQHKQLLQQVYNIFNVQPDFELDVMKPNQDLFHITQTVLQAIKPILLQTNPSLVLVQGDTTTAMAAALAAFYVKIPVGHIEAGLRSFVMDNPFPEEFNRRAISLIAQYHFAPTLYAVANLAAEKINTAQIFYTGNTVVDALYMMQNYIKNGTVQIAEKLKIIIKKAKEQQKKIVLFTTHRRESFGSGTHNILSALQKVACMHPNVLFFYPVHPNPAVQKLVEELNLAQTANIVLLEPLAYQDMVYVLMHTDFVATDSGGLCEEAVSLNKQVLILRDETERMEAVWAQQAYLVGTQTEAIVHYMCTLIEKNNNAFQANSIFGSGDAAEKIVKIVQQIAQNTPVVFSTRTGQTITSSFN